MHKFRYDCKIPKYEERAKLCYMDTDSFIQYKKQTIFVKKLQMMLKQGLVVQIFSWTDCCWKEKKQDRYQGNEIGIMW